MDHSYWVNTSTGEPLKPSELAELRARAHRLYAVNAHIFEDEADALTALGAVPLLRELTAA
jgi:hypothetical protein